MANETLNPGQSDADKRVIDRFIAARDVAREYCRGQFDKGVRFYRLFSGMLPAELDGCLPLNSWPRSGNGVAQNFRSDARFQNFHKGVHGFLTAVRVPGRPHGT